MKIVDDSFISNLSYTDKDFQTIYPEILDLAKKLSYRWDPTISNESDPGVVLLKLNAIIADKNNYNIDKNVLETFPVSVTQDKNARQIYELLGYTMGWYKAAEVDVSVAWIGEKSNSKDAYTAFDVPQFAMFADSENKIVYTTIEPVNMLLNSANTADSNSVNSGSFTVKALQGVITDFKVNGETNITIRNLDNFNRLYFSSKDVAENGIFVSNINSNDAYNTWKRVYSLATQELGNDDDHKFFKFGIDSISGYPYIQFPENIDQLIGSGLNIKYIKTLGAKGNIAANILTSIYSEMQVESVTVDLRSMSAESKQLSLSNSNLSITNNSASIGGEDPETLDEAYSNFQKTIGTFDTLVTLRDYINYFNTKGVEYNLLSNSFVTDRTNDIQSSYNIIQTNNGKTSMKLQLAKKNGVDEIQPFDLKLYALQYTNVPSTFGDNAKTTYDEGFKIFETATNNHLNEALNTIIEESKSIQHNFIKVSNDGKICFFINKFPIEVKVIPYYKVESTAINEISRNISNNLYAEFCSRNLKFGDEISYNSVYDVILNSDERIQNVILSDIDYTTYAIYYDHASREFRDVAISDNYIDSYLDLSKDSKNLNVLTESIFNGYLELNPIGSAAKNYFDNVYSSDKDCYLVFHSTDYYYSCLGEIDNVDGSIVKLINGYIFNYTDYEISNTIREMFETKMPVDEYSNYRPKCFIHYSVPYGSEDIHHYIIQFYDDKTEVGNILYIASNYVQYNKCGINSSIDVTTAGESTSMCLQYINDTVTLNKNSTYKAYLNGKIYNITFENGVIKNEPTLYSDKLETFRNEVFAKSVLAGRTQLLEKARIFNNSIDDLFLNELQDVKEITPNTSIVFNFETIGQDNKIILNNESTSNTLRVNENINLLSPSMVEDMNYSNSVRYLYSSTQNVTVAAESDYQLRPTDKLALFWKEEDSESAPYKYAIYTSKRELELDNNSTRKIDTVIRTTFDLTVNINNDAVPENLRNLVNSTSETTFGETSTDLTRAVGSLKASAYNLTATDQLSLIRINEIYLSSLNGGDNSCYWILNKRHPSSDGKYEEYVLFNEGEVERILQSGEYFLYTNSNKTAGLGIMESGTKLIRTSTNGSLPKWSVRAVDYSEINSKGASAISEDDWFSIKSAYFDLILREMTIYTFAEGVEIRIIKSPTKYNTALTFTDIEDLQIGDMQTDVGHITAIAKTPATALLDEAPDLTTLELSNDKSVLVAGGNEIIGDYEYEYNYSSYVDDEFNSIYVDNNGNQYIDATNYVICYKLDEENKKAEVYISTAECHEGQPGSKSYFESKGLYNCYLRIPSKINDYTVVEIAAHAFEDIPLSGIIIPNTVTKIGAYAFKNCGLNTIIMSNNIESIGTDAFAVDDGEESSENYTGNYSISNVYINDLINWSNVTLTNKYSSPLYNADNLYINNELITNLKFPTGYYVNDVLENSYAIQSNTFSGLNNLESVVIPSNVQILGNDIFKDCQLLKKFTIISESVINIQNAFGVSNLETLECVYRSDNTESDYSIGINQSLIYNLNYLKNLAITVKGNLKLLGEYITTGNATGNTTEYNYSWFKNSNMSSIYLSVEGTLEGIVIPSTEINSSVKTFLFKEKSDKFNIDNAKKALSYLGLPTNSPIYPISYIDESNKSSLMSLINQSNNKIYGYVSSNKVIVDGVDKYELSAYVSSLADTPAVLLCYDILNAILATTNGIETLNKNEYTTLGKDTYKGLDYEFVASLKNLSANKTTTYSGPLSYTVSGDFVIINMPNPEYSGVSLNPSVVPLFKINYKNPNGDNAVQVKPFNLLQFCSVDISNYTNSKQIIVSPLHDEIDTNNSTCGNPDYYYEMHIPLEQETLDGLPGIYNFNLVYQLKETATGNIRNVTSTGSILVSSSYDCSGIVYTATSLNNIPFSNMSTYTLSIGSHKIGSRKIGEETIEYDCGSVTKDIMEDIMQTYLTISNITFNLINPSRYALNISTNEGNDADGTGHSLYNVLLNAYYIDSYPDNVTTITYNNERYDIDTEQALRFDKSNIGFKFDSSEDRTVDVMFNLDDDVSNTSSIKFDNSGAYRKDKNNADYDEQALESLNGFKIQYKEKGSNQWEDLSESDTISNYGESTGWQGSAALNLNMSSELAQIIEKGQSIEFKINGETFTIPADATAEGAYPVYVKSSEIINQAGSVNMDMSYLDASGTLKYPSFYIYKSADDYSDYYNTPIQVFELDENGESIKDEDGKPIEMESDLFTYENLISNVNNTITLNFKSISGYLTTNPVFEKGKKYKVIATIPYSLPIGAYILPMSVTTNTFESIDVQKLYKYSENSATVHQSLAPIGGYKSGYDLTQVKNHYLGLNVYASKDFDEEINGITISKLEIIVSFEYDESNNYTITILPLVNYVIPDKYSKTFNTLKSLDIDNDYDYTYQVDESIEIKNPLDAKSFFDPYHIYNKFTIGKIEKRGYVDLNNNNVVDDIEITVMNKVR